MKRIFSLVLAAALVLGFSIVPAAAAGTFSDVHGPLASEAVEILHQLGVVDGKPGGVFDPDSSLSRAEFCKMALTVLNRQGEAAAQSSRVIFNDVTATHWALGYINAAARSGEDAHPIIQGTGDGRFLPNDAITYGQATAILMRCLGYTDADVGVGGKTWYAGYLLTAEGVGLLDDIAEPVDGDAALTRSAAAVLFHNLLFASPKEEDKLFLETQLGGSVTGSQLVLSLGEPLSGGGYAVRTDKGSARTFRAGLALSFQGQRAKLVLDRNGDVLTLWRDEDFTTKTVRITSAEARYVLADDGEMVKVPADTPLWLSQGTESTYGEEYTKLAPGATAILCYDKTDALVYIYLTGSTQTQTAAVALPNTRPFAAILPSGEVAVYKNGVLSTMSAVKDYDVGVLDPGAKVLSVSDNKLTGVYENAAPSPVSPSTVTVMGHAFPVLDAALADLTHFKIGDRVTLLLTQDYQVAGVVSPDKVSALAYGVAQVQGSKDDYTATVTLASGGVGKVTLSGKVNISSLSAAAAPGRLVAVSSSKAGELTLTYPDLTPPTSPWSPSKGKLGSLTVLPQAAVYDKVEGGALKAVSLADVTVKSVPADKILHYATDSAGNVNLLILSDVTGECYTYGLLSKRDVDESYGDALSTKNLKVFLQNSAGEGDGTAFIDGQGLSGKLGSYYGVAPSLSNRGGTPLLAASVELRQLGTVPRSAFGTTTVTFNGADYPLASNIDDLCYNASAKTWFSSLDDALAYSSRLTLYFDRSLDAGGKVRLVVAK